MFRRKLSIRTPGSSILVRPTSTTLNVLFLLHVQLKSGSVCATGGIACCCHMDTMTTPVSLSPQVILVSTINGLLASAERYSPVRVFATQGIRGPRPRPRMNKRERAFEDATAHRPSSLACRSFLFVRHGSSSDVPGPVTTLLIFVGTGVSL